MWRLCCSLSHRKARRLLASTFVLVVLCYLLWTPKLDASRPNTFQPKADLSHGPFTSMHLKGFINTGDPARTACDDLRHAGLFRVQESFYIDDDLVAIAKSLDGHPMIDYAGQPDHWSFEELVNKTWAQLAQSSIWLEQQQVFFAVSRVMFYNKGHREWPLISFLRGQIFDEEWNELKDSKIDWHGNTITFPTIFDIPTPYRIGDAFFGPEDPRIIIEEGVDDAEPIVTFNMMNDIADYFPESTRAMYAFRPFSNVTTPLYFDGQSKLSPGEKNWMPFFHRDSRSVGNNDKQLPSQTLHFIYSFRPLRVLRCHLDSGLCDFVPEQTVPTDFMDDLTDKDGKFDSGWLTGGTNLVPVTIPGDPDVHSYVGFLKTHINVGCWDKAMYRPELMIMTAFGNQYHVNFVSASIDFGTAAMSASARADPCGGGRIMIVNNIARWHVAFREDIMTLSFTVDDSTMQVLRLQGVWNFIQNLPHLKKSFEYIQAHRTQTLDDSPWSEVSDRALACTIEAAQNYSVAVVALYNETMKVARNGDTVQT